MGHAHGRIHGGFPGLGEGAPFFPGGVRLVPAALLLCVLASLETGCRRDLPPASSAFLPSGWERMVVADSSFYARPGAVKAGDLDGDGDRDIAAVGPHRCLWFENRGGSPPAFLPHSVDDQGCANALLVMDVDRDGRLDLVSAGGAPPEGESMPGPLLWWRNPGPRSEHWSRQVLDPQPGNFLHDILCADLDGDGILEIVALRGAAYLEEDHAFDGVVIYRRKVAGGGEPAAFERIPLQGAGGAVKPEDFSLAAGDLDRDGFADLVQFQNVWLNPQGRLKKAWAGVRWTDRIHPSSLVVADMDKDGRPDVVFAEGHSHRKGASRVGVWFNEEVSRRGIRGTVRILGTVAQDPENLAVADLDGNGVPDVVTGAMNWRRPPADPRHPGWNDADGTVVIFAGRPAGGRPAWVECVIREAVPAFHHLALADLDGDGALDILGENAGVKPPPEPVTPSVQVLLRRGAEGAERR